MKSEKEIKEFIDSLTANENNYIEQNDIAIYENVKKICTSFKYYEGTGKILVLIGNYHFKKGAVDLAFDFYREAIEILHTKTDNFDLLLKLITETAFKAYKQQNLPLANSYFNDGRHLMECHNLSISEMTQYFYFYYRGIYLLQIESYNESHDSFTYASNITNDPRSKSSAINLIGLIYKKQGNYEKAIEYYKESISIIDNHYNPTKSSFYNNLAEVLRLSGKLDEATYCVERAFELLGDTFSLERQFNLYDTYARINLAKGQYDKNIDRLIEYLSKNNLDINKLYIIQTIKLLIEIADINNNKSGLVRIKRIILDLMATNSGEVNSDFLSNLEECLGDITQKINYDKGGKLV